MIVTRTNNSATALANWTATADARAISAINEPTYTDAEKFKGDLFERLVTATFYKSKVFKIYRQNFIAIKACNPSAEELISDECRKLYDACELHDIQVVHTKTGVIFRSWRS